MSAELWADKGPISQGKILTAVMQNREDEARKMLDGWTADDLYYLRRSCDRLSLLCAKAEASKRPVRP